MWSTQDISRINVESNGHLGKQIEDSEILRGGYTPNQNCLPYQIKFNSFGQMIIVREPICELRIFFFHNI